MTGLKWSERRKEEKKEREREECWWFNQGSLLSIRHYADGERVSERHRRSEREREREGEGREKNSKRMIGEILQDCRRKKGKGGSEGGQAEGN